MIVDWQFVVLR